MDIVDRLINRFSNKDDIVFDPFGGLFTVPLQAIRMGRQGRACELNPEYYRDGLAYLVAETTQAKTGDLFDLLEATA